MEGEPLISPSSSSGENAYLAIQKSTIYTLISVVYCTILTDYLVIILV